MSETCPSRPEPERPETQAEEAPDGEALRSSSDPAWGDPRVHQSQPTINTPSSWGAELSAPKPKNSGHRAPPESKPQETCSLPKPCQGRGDVMYGSHGTGAKAPWAGE